MLAEDIETIINIQEVQLHSDNPFLEDYYFQNYMKKRNPSVVSADVIYRHRPICECFLPAGTLKQRPFGIKDPFEGVLGRTLGPSVRAPRPLVELKTTTSEEKEEKSSEGGNLVEDVDGGGFARALMARTAGLSSLNRTLLLSIETAFSDVLEIEDLNLLLSASVSDNRFNHQSLLEKRMEKINHLYSVLKIPEFQEGNNSPNMSPPLQPGPGEGFYSKEDEFFVRLISIAKGAKMLTRAIPILFTNQLLAMIVVILRNLHVIVHFPTNEESDVRLRSLFRLVLIALNGMQFGPFFNMF